MMNLVLWILQINLAVIFLMAGYTHTFRYEWSAKQLSWPGDLPGRLVKSIGLFEFFGAAGLILPAVTGISPWLTPMSALGLSLLMIAALVFHVMRREQQGVFMTATLLGMSAFVAFARTHLVY